MRITIAGASGFVGTRLIRAIAGDSATEITALSRSPIRDLPAGAKWRETDLFSAKSTFDALAGTDVAVFLVHSMMPSTRLFQGNFCDTDLLIADNFARACRDHGVRRIIYLGGLLPRGHVSKHLRSRHEVGDVFRATGIPVTELRAGMIVGPGGSSFEILRSLVERLPVLLLPMWTQRTTQAVHIDDIVRILAASVGDPRFEGRVLDAVNGEPLTYELLLRKTASRLQRRRLMIRVPIRSTEFSKRWVTYFGKASYELVAPLIESLVCDLPSPRPEPLISELIRYPSFESMLDETIRVAPESTPPRKRRRLNAPNSVRSIQRLPSVRHQDCHWISTEYMNWLPAFFRTWIRVESEAEAGDVRFYFGPLRRPLLVLKYIRGRADSDRKKFHIVGGLLTRTTDTGWLEFRQVQGRRYTLAAIHEFIPSLPWYLYRMVQAPLHHWVMLRFGRHLARAASRGNGKNRKPD